MYAMLCYICMFCTTEYSFIMFMLHNWPVLEYCSAVWCPTADTHVKLLDRAVRGARFLTLCVFECDIAQRRFVAVLCMLYKIRCNPMHPLNDALPGQHVPVRVTCGAMVTHRYTYSPPRCRTSQYRRTSVPLSVSFWNDLADPYWMVCYGRFKSMASAFLLASAAQFPTFSYFCL